MNLLAQVRDFIRRHELLTAGDGVVVGVSGGADSLCMLHLLVQLQGEYQLRLHVAHLDHGAREGSDADAAFVAEMARDLGLAVTCLRLDVPEMARAGKLSFEEAARRARYAFLAHVAGEAGASKVAVGHTADDQAETVLMHFLRGSGLAGLRGMLPVTPLDEYRLLSEVSDLTLPAVPPLLVRILLEATRAQVEAYCSEAGLEPRFDQSNLDMTFFRNRLRHELLPLLESYNPNVQQRLCNTARVVAADYQLLEQVRDSAWDEVVLEEREGRIVFDLVTWRGQHLSLQRALIRRAAYRLRPWLRDVGFVHVENAVQLARESDTGTRATLPDGLEMLVDYDHLILTDEGYEPAAEGPTLPVGFELPVEVPGSARLPGGEWILETRVLEEWSQFEVETNPDRWTAYIDADLVGDLLLRTRRGGDVFRPQGMEGHASRLSDWMINAKVPRSARDVLPLLDSGAEILWVCGWRLSDTALVRPETRRVVHLQFRGIRRGQVV